MLIIDIPKLPGSDATIRLGIIGSCQVRDLFIDAYNTNPNASGYDEGSECKKVWYKFSSFTHTPAHALQYLQFVSGELKIPEALHPLAFGRSITPDIQSRLDTITPEILESIDLFVITVATLQEFFIKEYQINISYTETRFIRSGGRPLLKWWRSVSTSSDEHEAVVEQTLDALPTKDLPNSESIRSIIKNTQSHVFTTDELAASLVAAKRGFGKPIMVVPHFNVPDAPSPSKSELIDTLYELSHTVGFHLYDPTLVIAKTGREEALDGGGIDINHYAPGFHYVLVKDVVPFIQNAVENHEEKGVYTATRYNTDSLKDKRY